MSILSSFLLQMSGAAQKGMLQAVVSMVTNCMQLYFNEVLDGHGTKPMTDLNFCKNWKMDNCLKRKK